MTDWKEHPHLFANGKFDLWYEPWKKVVEYYGISKHFWSDNDKNRYSGRIQILHSTNHVCTADISDCTLIARPISDMTDEELDKFDSIKHQAFFDLGSRVTIGEPSFYLLSIGVYPFDQNHFKDGTVIDSREVD